MKFGPGCCSLGKSERQALVRPLEMAAHESDQPIEFIGDLGQAHVNVIHALIMNPHAFLHIDDVLGLELLHLSLTALDLCHHDGSILKFPDFLIEVHLNLV
jgi:hypothetical protein